MSTEPIPPGPAPPARIGGWRHIFRPAPALPVTLTDPQLIKKSYATWQWRVLIFSILGYATFYLVRKNLGFAKLDMESKVGLDDKAFGIFITLHGVLYGISKFANGFLGDRTNARTFMAVGLTLSAVLNIIFGVSSGLWALGLIWLVNGWVQGMGYPPCARLISNWFPPKQLATKFSTWNASHCIGGATIILLCSWLLTRHWPIHFDGWRLCFLVPAGIALIIAVVLWFNLPDTPPSVGLPELEGTETKSPAPESRAEFRAFLMENVFGNRYVWLVSGANFFVYTIRYAVFDWGPTVLRDAKHITIVHSAWMLVAFEAFGLLGALLGGWITDRFLGGRAGRACVVYMTLAGVFVYLFWKVPAQSEWLTTGLLCAIGFFVYGPQCLLAIVAANLATKRAAATAVGLTSLFGYASTVLSGWGLGTIVKNYGWDRGFAVLIGCAAAGTILFICVWPAKAHGYKE